MAALADRAWGPRRAARAPAGLVAVDPAPLILAQRARAQVLPGAAWRAPDGMIAVRFHAPFTMDPTAGGLTVARATASLSQFFDSHVRAHPTQWFDWSIRAQQGPVR